MTTWTGFNAWAIEITKWEVKPYDPKGDAYQAAGKASGRLAICYQHSGEDYKDAWIAGVFENVPVRYMGGTPFYAKEKK